MSPPRPANPGDGGEIFDIVAPPRKIPDKEFKALAPEQAPTLLPVAEQRDPQAVPAHASALFAGIRAGEVRCLRGYHITLGSPAFPPTCPKRG